MNNFPHERMSKEEERRELETKSVYATKAMDLFRNGYNCAQSVFGAFASSLGLDFETAVKIASSFGGGIARMREVCGAVSGMCMVAGYAFGYSNPDDFSEKAEHYKRIQQLLDSFRELNGSIICRELLGITKPGADNPEPEKRTAMYYQKRPCELLVGQAAMILEKKLHLSS